MWRAAGQEVAEQLREGAGVLVVCAEGLRVLLFAMLNGLRPLQLRLFINDVDPAETDTIDNYQEAFFPGYRPADLGTLGRPYQTKGATYVETDAQPYTFTQAYPPDVIQTVYGYMVTTRYPHLMWAERAPIPVPMLTSGQQFTVRPSLTLTNQD